MVLTTGYSKDAVPDGFKLVRISTDAAGQEVIDAARAFKATFEPGHLRDDQDHARQRLFLAVIALENTEPA